MKLTLFFVAIGCLNEGVSSAAGESRPPRVEWQKSLGGASFEIPIQVIQTSDGGFVFAATSASGIGGSKTSPSFDTNTMVNPDLYRAPIGDYWLVKLDAAGSQLWDRSFGFGNRDDCWNLLELPDGGFVLGGESITDERLDPVLGVVAERDVFLLRADSHGNPLWNHRFGESGLDTWLGAALMPDASLLVPGFGLLARLDALGNRADWPVSLDRAPYYFAAVHRLSDGGFALIGSWPNPSLVTNGDLLIGGLTDISVGRFAADGRKLWEQTYGGRLSEFGYQVAETADGGLLVVGTSDSPPDERKHSPLFDAPGATNIFGTGGDLWLVRTDSTGQKLWEQSIGTGDFDIPSIVQPTSDGGWLMFWWTVSPDGSELRSYLTRIDRSGQTIWQQALEPDMGLLRMIEMPDGGFLLGGYARTGTNNLKSDAGHGNLDGWLLRLLGDGRKDWDLSLGGSGDDALRTLEGTKDGGFILGIASGSGASGNKTTASYGDYDLWALKLGPEGPPDSDGDGVSDGHDVCPNTPAGTVVDAKGCSIEQICPCVGPWKNHGDYVHGIERTAGRFVREGLLPAREAQVLLQRAAKSDCGK